MRKEGSAKGACKDLEQELVLYYYAESTVKDAKRIGAHLIDCVSCRRFLEELRAILPLTSKPDEPAENFWQAYSREIRQKLSEAEERTPWLDGLLSFFRLRRAPALAAVLVLMLVVVLTLSEGIWHSRQRVAEKQEPTWAQIEPIAANMDFFRTMDLLDSIDLLESIDTKGNGHRGV